MFNRSLSSLWWWTLIYFSLDISRALILKVKSVHVNSLISSLFFQKLKCVPSVNRLDNNGGSIICLLDIQRLLTKWGENRYCISLLVASQLYIYWGNTPKWIRIFIFITRHTICSISTIVSYSLTTLPHHYLLYNSLLLYLWPHI